MTQSTYRTLYVSLVVCAFGTHAVTHCDAQTNAVVDDHSVSKNEQSSLLALFSEFDRAYIPALASTQQQKSDASAAALARLQLQAPETALRALEQLGSPADEIGAEVTAKIERSLQLVSEGKLTEAHETLEPLRDLLAEVREQCDVDYPLDSLNKYHAVMESIVKPAAAATAGRVDDKFIARLRQNSIAASAGWAAVEQTDFSEPYFRLNDVQLRSLEQTIMAERMALVELNHALRSEDVSTILQAAIAVKPPFAKCYMTFGDFPTSE